MLETTSTDITAINREIKRLMAQSSRLRRRVQLWLPSTSRCANGLRLDMAEHFSAEANQLVDIELHLALLLSAAQACP